MLTLGHETRIARRPDEVFPVAVDPHRQLQWDTAGMQSVEKLTPGPLDRGARYRGRWKRFGTIEYEFVGYDPPRSFAHDARLLLGRAVHTFTFEEDGGHTRLRQSLELTPGPVGRILLPVIRPLVQRRLVEIGEELKRHVESEPDASAGERP